ncbi:LLM class flavin-dependent oxidoreductase [Gordonia sp. CPCC 205515]|uniref:LLM class flavin-dependent oxidoreductase n=1 Tax=Gordonia sp. CPCC 205515 TaxID=3140791 RepID=UPI003AF3B1D7
MKLLAFDFNGPAHLSAGLWRHERDRGADYTDIRTWIEYAKKLEAACFDGMFFADNDGYHEKYNGSVADALRDAAQIPTNDPSYLVPAMAAATRHLGFGVTTSTAYTPPYTVARKFTTLDHVTDGRIGWNVVTSYSDSAARNLGNGTQLAHDERYERAEEFIDVALKLWEGSWDDDAVVRDKETGTYVDPERVHEIAHEGKHFTVPGIFACEPSTQRTPVIFQAGGSPAGVALAAKTAEAVFMNSMSKPGLKKQVDALRAKALEFGRNPDHIAVLQMITVISAPTDEEAQRKYEQYRELVSYDGAMARYSGWTGLDMAQFDPDQPFEDVQTNAAQTMVDVYTKLDSGKKWTPRDIALENGIGGTSPVIVGGPETVAAELISWMEETGVDGFNVAHAIKFADVEDFITYVVPELQRRGAMRTSYEGNTLRENLFGEGNTQLFVDHPGAAHHRAATTGSPEAVPA